MKKTKFYVTIFLLLSIFLIDVSKIVYANEDISQTIKIEKMNIGNVANTTYTYELDLPKDFGELISYSFENISGSTVKPNDSQTKSIQAVDYDNNRNKLLIKFNMGNAITKKVDGYADNDKLKFLSHPYNAVCRYSDGARWQINEVRKGKTAFNDAYYQIVDMTKYGATIPTTFQFDKFTAQSQTRLPYENVIVGYWVDTQGNQYSQSQIKPNSRYVKKEAISFPKGMNVSGVYFDFFTEKNPLISFKYSLATLEKVEYKGITLADFQPHASNTFMTGYAECHKYIHAVQYYVSAETNPVSNIVGTFNYKYKKTDEPKIITTIEANPSSVKFNNQTINVQVTLRAEVTNIKAGAIKEYKLYLRTEDNTQNPQPLGYKKSGNSLTATVTDTFTIPASKLANKNEFYEYFVGRAYAYTTQANNAVLMSDLVKTSTHVYKNNPIAVEENLNIQAKIQGNTVVKKGDDTSFSSYGSSSTAGAIVGYRWVLENAKIQPPSTYEANNVMFTTWYEQLGKQRAVVYVIDEKGNQAGTYMDFEVVEPTIEVSISHTGTRKENRKVTIQANVQTPTRYPLSEITWNVQSLTGTLDSHIKHEANLSGKTSFDVLFKQAGEYLITAHVKNSAGYTNQATYVIEIEEDKPPQVDFDFQQKVYRDPSNNNMATFELTDYSYSYDGDYINQRNWYVIFDSNNDGIFNEARVLFNTGNNKEVTYSTNHVGKYRFILEAIEEFGEPTIAQYVTESDRRRNNTDAW